jgi:hypothetical protein
LQGLSRLLKIRSKRIRKKDFPEEEDEKPGKS